MSLMVLELGSYFHGQYPYFENYFLLLWRVISLGFQGCFARRMNSTGSFLLSCPENPYGREPQPCLTTQAPLQVCKDRRG